MRPRKRGSTRFASTSATGGPVASYRASVPGARLLVRPPRFTSFSSGISKTNCPHFAEVRSEEHTSELQSRQYLVCRLLLEKKKKYNINHKYCTQSVKS